MKAGMPYEARTTANQVVVANFWELREEQQHGVKRSANVEHAVAPDATLAKHAKKDPLASREAEDYKPRVYRII